MDEKLKLINKLYPWYSGLSNDLIFYITINTIWLTYIKGFSAAQITFLFTISSLFIILFQIPSLTIIKKIGNTNTIRIGSFLLLISNTMLTFCSNYIFFAIANIFLEMALVFEMMSAIIIKNNLDYQNKCNDFVKIRSKSNLIYAISTTIITIFVGLLFNIYPYLPMILGIITCLFCFIISFFIFDIDEKNKFKEKKLIKEKCFIIPKPTNVFFLILIFYGLSYGIVVISQQNAKLLIQYQLLELFTIEFVATLLGIILFISRLTRVITDYIFPTIYKKINNKICILLVLSLFISSILILIGYYLDTNFYIRLVIIILGFSILPSLRDPLKLYSQNFIFETINKKYHQDTLIYLSLARHIGRFLFSLISSYILIKYPIHYLFINFIIMTIPIIYVSKKITTLKY